MTKVVDLFAGIGGTSTGARQAGCEVLAAANHWHLAVHYHKLNHPETKHYCQDLFRLDFNLLPRAEGLLASPCCQGHSKARGKSNGNPQHDASRATAWCVIDALQCGEYEWGVVENVPEFMEWILYPSWLDAINRLGYSFSPHVVDVADLGVPQNRERMFGVITKSRKPIQLALPKLEHVGADSFIDFSKGSWSLIEKEERSAATLARVANGRRQFGDRFVMPYYGSGSGLTGRDLARPIGTITTKARWALVDGDRMRMLTVDENRDAMTFPRSTILPATGKDAIHMLGNAVPPLAAQRVIEAVLKAA